MRSVAVGGLDELVAEVAPPARAGRADLPRPRVLLLYEGAPQRRGEPRRPAIAVSPAVAFGSAFEPVREGALETDVLEQPTGAPEGSPGAPAASGQ